MAIAAGDMTKRVEVQELLAPPKDLILVNQFNEGPSPANPDDWQTICTRWAKVWPLSGRELFQAQQIRADITHRVQMRYFKNATSFRVQPGVKATMRLLLQGRPLYVLSCVDIEERHIELDLMCMEEV